MPEPTSPTGGTTVDTALQLLDGLEDRPVGEHVEVYDAVHRALQDALATLDQPGA